MKQHLHTGARWLFRLRIISRLSGLLVFALTVAILISRMNPPESLIKDIVIRVTLGIIVLIIFMEVYARMAYNRWMYEFTSQELKIESGIIWKKYSSVPYNRIQNIDIQRGVLARVFGFSSMHLQTAGYSAINSSSRRLGHQHQSHTEGYLPAISIKEAEEIRDVLLKHVSKQHSNSGV